MKPNKNTLDSRLFTEIELEDVNTNDYPDFVDAFAVSALYNGRQATDDELDYLNTEAWEMVHAEVMDTLF